MKKEFDPIEELKLCLLHDCLTPEGATEILSDTAYNELLTEVYEDRTLRVYRHSDKAS